MRRRAGIFQRGRKRGRKSFYICVSVNPTTFLGRPPGLKCIFQSKRSRDLSRPIFRTICRTAVYALPQRFERGISLSFIYPTEPIFGPVEWPRGQERLAIAVELSP
jgi:hypothetical protein